MPRKIIIDTDPGKDDAVAILLALAARDELDVLALVAVAGNIPLARTSLNALKLVELGGRPDLPVYAGCARPLRRPLVTAEHVHGADGINGLVLPAPLAPLQSRHGVDAIINMVRAAPPGEITLCTLGPLTNVALAFVKAPDIVARVREVIMMAGAHFAGGNVTPAAEFNVYVDPDAADIVLRSGVPIVMLPLDVTHQARATPARLDRFRALGNRCGAAVHAMLSQPEFIDPAEHAEIGSPLHDPTVIAWLLRPDLFAGRSINVEVETAGTLTLGATVADWRGVTGRAANVLYIRDIDADGFFRLLEERVARLP